MSDFIFGMSILSWIDGTTKKVFSPLEHQEPIKFTDKSFHLMCPWHFL